MPADCRPVWRQRAKINQHDFVYLSKEGKASRPSFVDSRPKGLGMASTAPASPGDPATQVQKVVRQQPRSSPRRAVRSSPRRTASGEEQAAACPPTQIRFEESSLSVPQSTRSSPRKACALMAEEASAPTSHMRSLAKCFEDLSSANIPPVGLAPPPPQPKVRSMQPQP